MKPPKLPSAKNLTGGSGGCGGFSPARMKKHSLYYIYSSAGEPPFPPEPHEIVNSFKVWP